MPDIEHARSWYPPNDPVHGFDHVLRVYRLAERIARAEGADLEIVRAAVLLHDSHYPPAIDPPPTGPEAEPEDNPSRTPGNQTYTFNRQPSNPIRENHQHHSAEFARRVLRGEGWAEERIEAVLHCIRAHRFRDDRESPQTLEARVVFDADKLDAIGAIGAARAVAYAALHGQPAYAEPSERFRLTGEKEPGEPHSAYHEYVYKLSKLNDRLYTQTARRIAAGRQRFLAGFYERLIGEIHGEL